MKKNKRNLVILTIALALVFYFTLKDDFNGILGELSKINIILFLLAILVFFTSLFFKSISLSIFIKEYKREYPFIKCFSLTLIGQFLNGITPFQTGGQPFQIYLLKKDNIKVTQATNAMIKDSLSFQIALVIMSIVAFIADGKLNILKQAYILKPLVFVGFTINITILILLLTVICTKKSIIKIINKFIDFIFKFKILKKTGFDKEKIKKEMWNFYKNGKEIKKSKFSFILAVITNVINLVILYLVPYVVFKSFGVNDISVLNSLVVVTFITLIGNFIPLPGATGGIEYSFIRLFKTFSIRSSVLSSVMLIWRFITYIFNMLIGFITLIVTKGVEKK